MTVRSQSAEGLAQGVRDGPRVLFHVTPTEVVPDIAIKGIMRDMPMLWEGEIAPGHGKGNIFTFSNYKSALRWATKVQFEKRLGEGGVSIIAHLDDGGWSSDPHMSPYPGALTRAEPVLPDKIISAKAHDFEMMKSLGVDGEIKLPQFLYETDPTDVDGFVDDTGVFSKSRMELADAAAPRRVPTIPFDEGWKADRHRFLHVAEHTAGLSPEDEPALREAARDWQKRTGRNLADMGIGEMGDLFEDAKARISLTTKPPKPPPGAAMAYPPDPSAVEKLRRSLPAEYAAMSPADKVRVLRAKMNDLYEKGGIPHGWDPDNPGEILADPVGAPEWEEVVRRAESGGPWSGDPAAKAYRTQYTGALRELERVAGMGGFGEVSDEEFVRQAEAALARFEAVKATPGEIARATSRMPRRGPGSQAGLLTPPIFDDQTGEKTYYGRWLEERAVLAQPADPNDPQRGVGPSRVIDSKDARLGGRQMKFSRERMHEMDELNRRYSLPDYPYYVVSERGKVYSGWENAEDARDHLQELQRRSAGVDAKVQSAVGFERQRGRRPLGDDWMDNDELVGKIREGQYGRPPVRGADLERFIEGPPNVMEVPESSIVNSQGYKQIMLEARKAGLDSEADGVLMRLIDVWKSNPDDLATAERMILQELAESSRVALSEGAEQAGRAAGSRVAKVGLGELAGKLLKYVKFGAGGLVGEVAGDILFPQDVQATGITHEDPWEYGYYPRHLSPEQGKKWRERQEEAERLKNDPVFQGLMPDRDTGRMAAAEFGSAPTKTPPRPVEDPDLVGGMPRRIQRSEFK